MATRRNTGLIVVGIAALLFLALIFIGPAFIKADRYRPQVISFLQEKNGKAGRNRSTGTHSFSAIDSD